MQNTKSEVVEKLKNIMEEIQRNHYSDVTTVTYLFVYRYVFDSQPMTLKGHVVGKQSEGGLFVLLTKPKRKKKKTCNMECPAVVQLVCTVSNEKYDCFEVVDYSFMRKIEIVDVVSLR